MLFDTGLYLMPDEGVGFFISHSGGNGAVNIRIFQAFLDRYFPYEAMAVPEPAPGSRERAAAFAGEYYQNRRSFTTIDAFLSLLFGRIHVSTDQEGHLLVILEGETNRFVEAEPGVFVNVQGGSETFGGVFRTVVFGTDPFGKTMLMTDGPMSYSRAYWYETTGLTFLMLISSILFILGSVLYWGLKALIRRMRKRNIKGSIAPAGAVWAKRTVSVLGLLTFVFVGGFLSGGEVDPVYQLPAEAFMPPSALSTLIDAVVPHGMVLLALAVLVFTVLAWVKGYWKAAGRIHYTLIAVFSGVLSWLFYFWNVI